MFYFITIIFCLTILRCSICWSLTVLTRSRSLCGSMWASANRSPSPAVFTSTVQSAGLYPCAIWRPPSPSPIASKAPLTPRPVRGEHTSREGASPWLMGWRPRKWYLTGEPGVFFCVFEWQKWSSVLKQTTQQPAMKTWQFFFAVFIIIPLFHSCFMLYTRSVTQTVPVQLRHQWHHQNQSRNLCPNAGCVCVCDTSIVVEH